MENFNRYLPIAALLTNQSIILINRHNTTFYVLRVVALMKTAKVNAYIMYIFGKIGVLSIHAA